MIPILSITALLLGGFIALFNWYTLYAARTSGRNVSSVPLVGAVLLTAGLSGFPETRPYAWLGFIIDFGTLELLRAIPRLIKEAWQTSSSNLVHRFTCEGNGRRTDIRLFKKGICIIKCVHEPAVPCNEQGALVQQYGLVGTWLEQEGVIRITGYAGERLLEIRHDGALYISTEHNYPLEKNYSYDKLDGMALKITL